MKCFILAAGYATRLYPLTQNFPKPLLKVKDKTILDWLIDDLEATGKIDSYVVISNHKFANIFDEWARAKSSKITVIDDMTSTNETRLGAVRDIDYAMDKVGMNDEEDCIVIAGDNLLDFSLSHFISFAQEKRSSCVMRFYEADTNKLRKSGVATVDDNDLIVSMVEKPEVPTSNWICPPFYYYVAEDIPKIGEGINDGCGVDAPGSFIAWLSQKTKVYAMKMPGSRYDIGNIESYEFVKENYNGIEK